MTHGDDESARVPAFARLLLEHRKKARLSQLALAGNAGISARHLGFLELGRAQPSAAMVRKLAGALMLSRGGRDRMLLAAGFAPDPSPVATMSFDLLARDSFATAVLLASAQGVDTAVELAAAALEPIGIRHFISGVIRRTPSGLVVDRDRAGRPAVGWMRHMQVNDYNDRDYLLAVTAARSRAYFWDEVRGDPMRADQRRILDEAADFRIGTGFVVPVQRPDGTVRAFSSWAERLDADAATRAAATLIATTLLDAIDRLAPAAERTQVVRLHPPHRDVLQRIADGQDPFRRNGSRTAEDIALLVDQATAVMGASSPGAAASRAAALGLLG